MSWLEDYWDWRKVYWREAPKNLHRKHETMNEDFIWTDELVAEFALQTKVNSTKDWIAPQLEQFKQSKLNSSNKDWEIVSYQDNCGEIWSKSYDYSGERKWDEPLKGYKIYSVRRLSDGEVFSVGDKISCVGVNQGSPIGEFKIKKDGGLYVCGANLGWGLDLKSIQKAKQPLFTTEDGKDLFEGDEYWFTHDDYRVSATKAGSEVRKNAIQKTFSTEEAAKAYVVMNKPCFSLSDIETILKKECDGTYSNDKKEWRFVYDYRPVELFKSFKERAKKKINGNTL